MKTWKPIQWLMGMELSILLRMLQAGGGRCTSAWGYVRVGEAARRNERGGEVRAVRQLLGGNDKGVDAVQGEGEENPQQRRHEETAEYGTDGMEVEEMSWGLLRGGGPKRIGITGTGLGAREVHRIFTSFL